ncbi:jg20525 [Pararge aegeria aegeria]|uniref:Jg20525 protein n=1 Tax=Pararge aegeria aegeria TaxID=348720 RepID=A0A8S4SDD5_9NEOP|nr:jg20525 [Pararge aegeria aegeria]
MARIMMFELFWDRMKSLRITMEENLKFSELVCDSQVELQISKLEEYLKVYGKLLNNLKLAGHASKAMVDFIYITDGAINTIVPLIPAIFAELATIQIEKIKTYLKRQLLVCPHNALRSRTYDALKFLELRPFKYTIWRAFSVNISLLLGLVNLCTTYTIVAIQFSHVYG